MENGCDGYTANCINDKGRMIKLKVKVTREQYDGYYELNCLHAYSSCAKPCASLALTSLAILVTVLHMMNMREDYLMHNAHCTFRAWLLALTLDNLIAIIYSVMTFNSTFPPEQSNSPPVFRTTGIIAEKLKTDEKEKNMV